jgi:hypothetical protein
MFYPYPTECAGFALKYNNNNVSLALAMVLVLALPHHQRMLLEKLLVPVLLYTFGSCVRLVGIFCTAFYYIWIYFRRLYREGEPMVLESFAFNCAKGATRTPPYDNNKC